MSFIEGSSFSTEKFAVIANQYIVVCEHEKTRWRATTPGEAQRYSARYKRK